MPVLRYQARRLAFRQRRLEGRSVSPEAHEGSVQHRGSACPRAARDARRADGKAASECHALLPDGDRVTIIASLRGWPKNPDWYYNLRKHPDVVFGGLPFRAEVVEDEADRQRLWELADRVYPQYANFREQARKAGRVIPIVQLVPR